MESKAKLFGHPLHPLLIVFPLGLLVTASFFDLFGVFKKRRAAAAPVEPVDGVDDKLNDDPQSDTTEQAPPGELARVSYYMIGAGVLTGLAAAAAGVVDWAYIPRGTRAKRVGLVHAVANDIQLTMYAASFLLRRKDPSSPSKAALALSFGGLAIGGFASWLGGELVHRLGVSVDEGANLNAPDALTDALKHSSVVARNP